LPSRQSIALVALAPFGTGTSPKVLLRDDVGTPKMYVGGEEEDGDGEVEEMEESHA
jgi:hypothetical protein